MSHISDLNFSSGRVRRVKKKKQVKLNAVYFIQPSISKILSFQHGIDPEIISEMFYLLFFLLSLGNPVCITHCNDISLWTKPHFKCLIDHRWLIATIVDDVVLEVMPEAFLRAYNTTQYLFNLLSYFIAQLMRFLFS